MGKCSDLLDVAVDSIVLVVDLLDAPGSLSKRDIKRALRAKQVRAEIQKAYTRAAADVLKKHRLAKPVTQREALEFLAKGGQVVGDRIQRELSQTLTCQLKESPLGIWYDRNEWILYIVVPVVVAGGAYGAKLMYDAKVGDMPASWATKLAGKHLAFRPVGGLRLGAKDPVFVPSNREVGVKLFATKNWEKLEATLTLGGGLVDGTPHKATTGASVTIPLDLKYKGVAGASTLDLSVKGYLERADDGGATHGGSAGAKLKTDLGPWSGSVGARGEWKSRGTGGGGPEYGVFLDVEILNF